MRSVLDKRSVWSGLMKRAVIAIPGAYSAGTIAVTQGSTQVTGTDTNWPVNDTVATITIDTILSPGEKWVQLASVQGITLDTVLYLDSTGANPEIVPVLDLLGSRVLVNLAYPHGASSSVTASSLNGLQITIGGFVSPVFTVIAVTSPTSLILDNIWGAGPQSGSDYQIFLAYTTVDPFCREILDAADPFQQIKLRINVTQEELDLYDPNRTAVNTPTSLASMRPNLNGNQRWEIYPPQLTPYQLNILYHTHWPDLRLPSDYPPPFMNPNVLIYGALADSFRTPCPKPPSGEDPFFSMDVADRYERKFEEAIVDLVSADDAKYLSTYTWNYAQLFGSFSMGSQWNQSHDIDAAMQNY